MAESPLLIASKRLSPDQAKICFALSVLQSCAGLASEVNPRRQIHINTIDLAALMRPTRAKEPYDR